MKMIYEFFFDFILMFDILIVNYIFFEQFFIYEGFINSIKAYRYPMI